MRDPREDRLPYGRRRRTAASALVAILMALVLGAFFNAPAMKKTAMELPFGGERSWRLALLDPLAAVSHWFYLDRPAKFTAEALGRPDPGPTPVTAVVVEPSPKPSSKPRARKRDRPLPKPYAGHPLHLYIGGDSMAGIPGMALVNLSNDTRLVKPLLDYHISSGLCRPDFFNWPAQLQQQAKSFDPGAAVVMFGANDNQAVETSSGSVYQFGTNGWRHEYRRRVRNVMDILFAGGARRIYWVGQPIMPNTTYDRQMRSLNDIYMSEAAKRPGVQFIDAYAVFTTGSGGYAQYLENTAGELQQVREADGEHLTYAGGLRLAKVIMTAIKADWLTRSRPAAKGSPSAPAPASSAKAPSKP